MTKKQKKALSTRQLMGIDQLTDHGLLTPRGELVFFLLHPDNLSVLSPEGVRGRVRALTELLRSVEAAELLALNSRQSFRSNQLWYRDRLEREDLPALRELLRRDMDHLDAIQSTAASAREFAVVLRPQAGEVSLEKRIRDCGFHVRRADRQDIMRLLAVYYQQDVTTEQFDRFDGERSANG